jgi:hypothetical protein
VTACHELSKLAFQWWTAIWVLLRRTDGEGIQEYQYMIKKHQNTTRRSASKTPGGRTDRQAVIALLEEWLRDESGYDEETWPELKKALDRDRLSARKLFDE